MQLSSIYETIQPELTQVEESLKSLAREAFPWMTELLDYTLPVAGKRIRPALTLLAGRFYHYDTDRLVPMAAAIELFHTATLVHDDVVDSSLVRRGQPTVARLRGEKTAVLLGDYLFAHSAEMVTRLNNLRVVKLFAQALVAISSGELRQNSSPQHTKLTRQHYFHWIGNKTASLFALATQCGAVLSRAPHKSELALQGYGVNLGLSFQVVDDILDLVGEEKELGKPVGADLLQGALTLPAILAAEHYPQEGALKKAPQDETSRKRALELMAQPAIIQECYSIASDFCSQALDNLKALPQDSARNALADLADYALKRRK